MSKNYRSIILLLFSIISCNLAQGLTIIAVPWHFADTLNQSSVFAILYAITTFIGLIWGIYAGVLIDNFSRKKILLYINFLSSAIFFTVGYLDVFMKINHPLLIFLGFMNCSLYYIIFFPNLYALAQELTQKNQYVKINSFIEIFCQLTNIVAATLCGMLLSKNHKLIAYVNNIFEFQPWSIGDLFLLNSALYFLTWIVLLSLKDSNKETKLNLNLSFTINEVKHVFRLLIKKKSILIYGVCSQIIFAFLIVELFTLLPLFVKNCLNEDIEIFSLADVFYGFGAIIAGVITFKILKNINKLYFTILLMVITGYSFFLMIKFITLSHFFFATIVIGITNASTRITRMSYLFEKIPNSFIGRANTIFNSINTLIRGMLILLFSAPWFSKNINVLIGYKIGILILALFTLPLIWQVYNYQSEID